MYLVEDSRKASRKKYTENQGVLMHPKRNKALSVEVARPLQTNDKILEEGNEVAPVNKKGERVCYLLKTTFECTCVMSYTTSSATTTTLET